MLSLITILTAYSNLTFGNIPTQFQHEQILSQHEMPLGDRQPVQSVNNVFRDNILLNIAYMENRVSPSKSVDWNEVRKPFHYEFRLEPNQSFAFHQDVLPEYTGKITKTTNAHFNSLEGFESDGYLVGDGVCHLASLLNWVARDANLEVLAPTNHDFAPIPDVPKEYGAAIYDAPGQISTSARENLYITNNKSKAVTFKLDYQNDNLKVAVVESD